MRPPSILIGALCLVPSAAAPADTIVERDGVRVEGTFVSVDAATVVLDTPKTP
jgi:hypothetical protein